MPRIPLIENLTSNPIPSGSTLLVEFNPDSQWYNASLTIAAGWITSDGTASYNAQAQSPESVRSQLSRLGLDVKTLETEERLRIIDWYTAQLGQKSQEKYATSSLKVADLSILYSKQMIPASGSVFPGTAWRLGADVLRVTDDELVLRRYNDEKSFIDLWRTRMVPSGPSRKSTNIEGVVKGVYSEYVYNALEATVDGIIDFKLEEEGKTVRDMMRIRSMRNVRFDREWHELKIGDNFEITLEK